MTEAVRGWLLSLAAAAMVTAVADALIPKGMAKRMARVLGGLLMLLVFIRPVYSLDCSELEDPLEGYRQQADRSAGALEEADAALTERLIEESTQAYIEEQAEQMGLAECRAQVRCRWEEELCIPWEVSITGAWTEEQQGRLCEHIAEELNIPAERQNYEGAEAWSGVNGWAGKCGTDGSTG